MTEENLIQELELIIQTAQKISNLAALAEMTVKKNEGIAYRTVWYDVEENIKMASDAAARIRKGTRKMQWL